MNRKKTSRMKSLFINYLENNLKEYITISIIFLIGIILGVIAINNLSEINKLETTNYISSFISALKSNSEIDEIILLKQSITHNVMIALLLWFIGSTVIGLLFVYIIIAFRGFCLGYTICALTSVLEGGKGLIFIFAGLFIHNLIYIPCIFALAVSGIKLYKSVIHNVRKDNIKIELLRHTMTSVFAVLMLALSSLVEVNVSKNLLLIFLKYI